ncbi:MAG: desulfoferrodoxin [Clostridia bacterium]|nr:desulfoferrodoxin [Clostridia bacterium]
MAVKFYKCAHCGNIIHKVEDKGVPVMCCGEKMQELVPNTTDAAVEKHVPIITKKCGKVSVNVGSVEHPMTEEHFISWICVASEDKVMVKYLKAGDPPVADFAGVGKDFTVYAYCNLHGLWADK